MPKFVGETEVKRLAKRDGNTESIDNLGSIQVNFTKQFVNVPKVFVNIDGDANFKITNKTKLGFKVKFKDGSFTDANYSGELDWEAVPDDVLE